MNIKSPGKKKPAAIRPARARYIKLGAGGEWEDECIEMGIIRFGFGSERPERFLLCRAGKWDKLTQSFIAVEGPGGPRRASRTRRGIFLRMTVRHYGYINISVQRKAQTLPVQPER